MNVIHSGQVDARPRSVRIEAGEVALEGEMAMSSAGGGVVIFAHGSGSSRQSPRNQSVAAALRRAGLGTLLFDLLTPEEAVADEVTGTHRFDIPLLSRRLVAAVQWLHQQPEGVRRRIGLFGASTGGAAALVAAATLGNAVKAVVVRGGRPDLAAASLDTVRAPTLFIVGGYDDVVLELNELALARLRCEKALRIVPGATHLFAEPGKLEEVARLAAAWFQRHLVPSDSRRSGLSISHP